MSDWFVLRTALRDTLRPKRLVTALLVILLPVVVALIWRMIPGEKFNPDATYNSLASLIVFRFTMTLLAVVYGTGVLSQEIEGRTIVYLLTRPLPRWRILLMKFIGAWIAITVTVSLSTVFTALVCFGAHPNTEVILSDLKVIPDGALCYGALFLLLATFLTRPLIVGLMFSYGWELWSPRMSGGFRRLSVMTHLETLAPHLNQTADGVTPATNESASMLSTNLATITPAQAWIGLPITSLVALLLAFYLFSTREYVPREEAG